METTQKKYQSIERHGKSGTHLTIEGNPYIVIQEKLDGANASFKREGDKVVCFSRNNQLDMHNTLRGFYNWVQETFKAEDLVENAIYYGEWLVRHKLEYGENENKFYLFDIFDEDTNRYISFDLVKTHSITLNLNLVPILYEGEFQSLEHIQSFVGKSVLGDIGEGVVVKNYGYMNKYGVQVFTKFVSDHFAEITNTKTHNASKNSDPLQQFINSTLTEARVSKLIHKLVDEGELQEDYAIEDMGAILKGLGSKVFDDIIKEEMDELLKLVKGKVGRAVPNIVKSILAEEGRS